MEIARFRSPVARLMLRIDQSVRKVVICDSPISGCFYLIADRASFKLVDSLAVLQLDILPAGKDSAASFMSFGLPDGALQFGAVVNGITASMFKDVTLYVPVGLPVQLLVDGQVYDLGSSAKDHSGADQVMDNRTLYDQEVARDKQKLAFSNHRPKPKPEPEPTFKSDAQFFTDDSQGCLPLYLMALASLVLLVFIGFFVL